MVASGMLALVLAAQPPQLDPAKSASLVQQAREAIAKNETDRAAKLVAEAIRLNPDDGDGYLVRAVIFGDRGDYSRAVADLDQLVRLRPKDGDSWAKRG